MAKSPTGGGTALERTGATGTAGDKMLGLPTLAPPWGALPCC
ncbi:hypothetical protein NON20_14840 [Synechocystis sp. B12]|nr:hypothetical protein NON20_14840 [Synechocystis sp. B12]